MESDTEYRGRFLGAALVCLVTGFAFGMEAGTRPGFTHRVIDASEDRPVKPYIKIIGDVDGDGFNDIVAASARGGGAVWYRSPTWTRRVVTSAGTLSEGGRLADVDGDGDLDAVLPGTEGVFWYENALDEKPVRRADPTQWEKHYVGSDGANVHDLSVADLDNDGDVEVIARYEKELRRPLTVWWQESPVQWTEASVFDHYGEGLGVGDVDGDGWQDLTINEIWLRNPGETETWRPCRFAEGMPDQLKVVCADLDADGRDEIVVSPQSRVPEGTLGKLAIDFLKSMEAGPQWEEVILQQGSGEVNKVHGIAVADMDLDGDLDLRFSFGSARAPGCLRCKINAIASRAGGCATLGRR